MKFHFRFFAVLILLLFLGAAGFFLYQKQAGTPSFGTEEQITLMQDTSHSPTPIPIPESYYITLTNFVAQTFNNCGPASLSMTLSLLGKTISQGELASTMRPFNNPSGGVDDKSIFAEEFVKEAKNQGFEALQRPNGTPELLKQFISQGIPVVVRTWLNDHEDIGHFRVVTGYNSSLGTITYQDSYYGPNQIQTEEIFNSLWQPFNYGYILVYPKEKETIVKNILGGNMDENVSYKNAIKRSEQEVSLYCHPEQSEVSDSQANLHDSSPTSQNDNRCAFATYNLATANYYLGNYDKTIEYYEVSLSGIPPRMLWYQPEPIYAYQKTKQYDKAIELADRILNNGNLAYSELYFVKGEIYRAEGNEALAREMYEKAIFYNTSFQPARDALNSL